jgi:hypothetical protein
MLRLFWLALIAPIAVGLFAAGLAVGLMGVAVLAITGSPRWSHTGAELIRAVERLPLPSPGPGRTYVYFLQDQQAATKIGISGDLRERLATLQTGHPEALYLVKAIPCRTAADARVVERDLHIYFERHRMNGEWFDLSERHLRRAIALARRWR